MGTESSSREQRDSMLSEKDASSSGESEDTLWGSLDLPAFVDLGDLIDVYVGLLLYLEAFLLLFPFGMATQTKENGRSFQTDGYETETVR